MEAVQGHFTTEALMLNQDSKLTIAGMTSKEWLDRYHREYKESKGVEITDDNKPEGWLSYMAPIGLTLALLPNRLPRSAARL